MRWSRANARFGASLALLALALNLALAFGHHHFDEWDHTSAVVSLVDADGSGHANGDHHHRTLPAEACLVCAILAAAPLSASAPQPPTGNVPASAAAGQVTTALQSQDGRRFSFEPRAPPRG